jgi:hypothetical protein
MEARVKTKITQLYQEKWATDIPKYNYQFLIFLRWLFNDAVCIDYIVLDDKMTMNVEQLV